MSSTEVLWFRFTLLMSLIVLVCRYELRWWSILCRFSLVWCRLSLCCLVSWRIFGFLVSSLRVWIPSSFWFSMLSRLNWLC